MELRGTTQQLNLAYPLESSGITKRMNHTLQDKARTMMVEAGVPSNGGFFASGLCAKELDCHLVTRPHTAREVEWEETISGVSESFGELGVLPAQKDGANREVWCQGLAGLRFQHPRVSSVGPLDLASVERERA